jgi:hypothetical protein
MLAARVARMGKLTHAPLGAAPSERLRHVPVFRRGARVQAIGGVPGAARRLEDHHNTL